MDQGFSGLPGLESDQGDRPVGLAAILTFATQVEVNRTYTLGVDLSLVGAERWPEEEGTEYPFFVKVSGYGLTCRAIGSPVVEVTLAGVSNEEATFAIQARTQQAGPILIEISNRYGVALQRLSHPVTVCEPVY